MEITQPQPNQESDDNNSTQSLTVTTREYEALDGVYGLEESVHMMVMLASPDDNQNWVLKGTSACFDALQKDLAEEIYSELSPPSRLKQLRKLYRRLAPDSDF